MSKLKKLSILLILSSFIFSIGCNELEAPGALDESSSSLSVPEGDSGSNGDSNDKPPAETGDAETDALSKDVAAMNTEYTKIESDISDINNDLDALSMSAVLNSADQNNGTSSKVSLSFGLADKLKKKLDMVIVKLELMAGKIDEMEAKILNKIASIDPLVQILLYDKLQKLLLKIDDMRGKVSLMLDKFEEKVDKIVLKVDDMIAKLDFSNPLHIVAYGALMEVKQVLVEFQQDLAQL